MEIVRQLGFRISAGYDYDEIAIMLEQHRTDLKHIELPHGPITKSVVQKWLRDLRMDIGRSHADATPD